ncbi:uroporphyrinogen-III C-methyltransferase [Halobacterium noricense]
MKAARLLGDTDVVLHDTLASEEIVDRAAASAEVIDVGKRPGSDGERTTQTSINNLMVQKAEEGKDVVRLKGGDPAVFARGGEEIEHLTAAGIACEFVPGITSAIAAPSIAGIPVTHREYASSLTIVTGHEDPTKDKSALNWSAIADNIVAGGTLVILMGVSHLADNIDRLRTEGVPTQTSVAIVENATRPTEFTVSGTLDTIVKQSRDVGVDPPAVTIVGDVVSIREQIADCRQDESVPQSMHYRNQIYSLVWSGNKK